MEKIIDEEKKTVETILENQKKVNPDSKTNYLQDYFPNCEFEYEDSENWVSYLKNHGIVIVKNVMTNDEVLEARNMYWNKIESIQADPETGIKRDNIKTWLNKNWPSH